MRIRALLVALTGATAAVLVPVGHAAAYQPFTPSITCDTAADRISSRVDGGALAANQPVTVKFTVHTGSWVRGAQFGAVPEVGQSMSVPATTAADGTVSAVGYSRPWPAANYDFYTETVRVTVLDRTGAEIIWGDADCSKDGRTALAATRCDPETGEIAFTTVGVGYPTDRRPLTVRYYYDSTTQRTADEPGLTRRNTGQPDASHSLTPAATGDWTDPGPAFRTDNSLYYRSVRLWTVVIDQRTGLPVGRGSATCAIDHR